jgi:hypothetical protein
MALSHEEKQILEVAGVGHRFCLCARDIPGILRRLLLPSLVLSAATLLLEGFVAAPAAGLVIYRWGGESMPLPSEAERENVEFIQLSWSDLEVASGGEAFQLDMDDQGIRALKLDPQVNLAVPAQLAGGVYQDDKFNQVFDGDLSNVWLAEKYLCTSASRNHQCDDIYSRTGTVQIDLQEPYLLDRLVLVSGIDNPATVVRNFAVHVATAVPRLTYVRPSPIRPFIVEIRDNRQQFRQVPIPARAPVRFVQVSLGEHNEDWEVYDIQVYGKGFVRRSIYQANIIDFGRTMNWGDLRWSGIQDPKAQVLIQTRSGLDNGPELFWRFTGRGGEKALVERTAYDGLKVGEKAGITYDQANWTFWSAPYDFADSSGAAVVSLSPRRYFQFKVDFLPQDNDGGQVGFLELRASEPVATNLVGEVWPIEALVGQPTRFTYALRPTIRAEDGGFDGLEIETSSLIQSVHELRVGDGAVAYEVEVQEPHRLAVRFPRLEARDSGALIEVEFEAQVLRYGATFAARVSDSARPQEVPQAVNVGNATAAYEGNRVSVATASVGQQSLLQVSAVSAVFTPNGDGHNDVVGIGYAILEIIGAAQVEVVVLDLSGRVVRRVYAGSDGIGEYQRRWDGRDKAGQLMPPGIYLYRVSVNANRGKVEKIGVVHAVY